MNVNTFYCITYYSVVFILVTFEIGYTLSSYIMSRNERFCRKSIRKTMTVFATVLGLAFGIFGLAYNAFGGYVEKFRGLLVERRAGGKFPTQHIILNVKDILFSKTYFLKNIHF